MKNITVSQFDICGIGMSMVDLVQVVDAFPAEGGITEAGANCLNGGGPVPTALCTAAKLGASVAVIDRVGDDWKGRLVRDEYLQYGVDTSHFQLEAGKTTTFGSVLVRQEDGERHVIFAPGNFTALESAELPEPALQSTRILHLNGRHWPACLDAADIVKEAGGLVSFDGGANRYDPKFDELLQKTDIAIVARDFAEKFCGSDDNATQLGEFVRAGAKIVGITDGAEGSWFATDEGEVFYQPAFPVERVVDTTGCGDAFHGGFLFGYSRDWSIRESAKFASAVAALNAQGLGGRGNLPSLGEVADLIQHRK